MALNTQQFIDNARKQGIPDAEIYKYLQNKGVANEQKQPVKKTKYEASSGLIGTFLPALTALPQAIGQLVGQKTIVEPAMKKVSGTVAKQQQDADLLANQLRKETDPTKKEKIRQQLRTAVNAIQENTARLTQLASGEDVRQATAINLGGIIGKVPALPPVDKPLDVAKVIGGRALKQVGVSALPVAGATAGFALMGAGTALEEGGDIIDVTRKAATYAATGKFLSFGFGKLATTQMGQRVLNAPVAQTVLKVGDKVFSPFMVKAAAPGTVGALVDDSFKKFGEITDKAFSPSTYTKPAISGIKKTVGAIGQQTGLARSPEQKLAEEEAKINKYWSDVKNRYKSLVVNDKNSPAILAREGIIPEAKGGVMITGDQAQQIKMKGSMEHSLLNRVIDESRIYGDVNEAKAQALRQISSTLKGVEKQQAIDTFNKQFDALVKDNIGNLVGEEANRAPLRIINDMKSYMWSQGYANKLAPKSDRVNAEAMRVAGNAFKRYIDTVARIENPEVADVILDLNQHSGELFQAEKFLDSVNGNKLPFGQIGRHFARTIGAIIGSPFGVGGGIAGTLTAEQIVNILQNPQTTVGKSAQIIAELRKADPKVVQDAFEILKKMAIVQSQAPALQAPSFVPLQAPKAIGTGKVNYLPMVPKSETSVTETITKGYDITKNWDAINDEIASKIKRAVANKDLKAMDALREISDKFEKFGVNYEEILSMLKKIK